MTWRAVVVQEGAEQEGWVDAREGGEDAKGGGGKEGEHRDPRERGRDAEGTKCMAGAHRLLVELPVRLVLELVAEEPAVLLAELLCLANHAGPLACLWRHNHLPSHSMCRLG